MRATRLPGGRRPFICSYSALSEPLPVSNSTSSLPVLTRSGVKGWKYLSLSMRLALASALTVSAPASPPKEGVSPGRITKLSMMGVTSKAPSLKRKIAGSTWPCIDAGTGDPPLLPGGCLAGGGGRIPARWRTAAADSMLCRPGEMHGQETDQVGTQKIEDQ